MDWSSTWSWPQPRRLNFGASMSFLHSTATSNNPLVGTPDGARLPNTPEFKASAYGSTRGPCRRVNGSAYVHVEYSYTGDSFNDIDQTLAGGDPPLRQAPMQVTDLSFGIETGGWDMAFTVDNVFDERGQIYRTFTAAHPLNNQSVNCTLSADPLLGHGESSARVRPPASPSAGTEARDTGLRKRTAMTRLLAAMVLGAACSLAHAGDSAAAPARRLLAVDDIHTPARSSDPQLSPDGSGSPTRRHASTRRRTSRVRRSGWCRRRAAIRCR